MGEILDDAEHEQEQRHGHKDCKEPGKELGQVLRRVGRDTEERQQVIEQRYLFFTPHFAATRARGGGNSPRAPNALAAFA